MSLTPLPRSLYDRTAHLVDAFCESAARHGLTRADSEALFRLLPAPVKSAPAFHSRIGDLWRYSYGEPLDGFPGDQVLFGTHQCPEVAHLFLALFILHRALSPSSLVHYLKRLEPPAKHHETLFEARPLFFLGQPATIEYEPDQAGAGNRLIDWRISPAVGVPVLVEVKYRSRDLVDHMMALVPDLNAGLPTSASGGPGDPAILFPDTYSKFVPADPSTRLQGAWIHTHIKVREADLLAYFASLPPYFHFAVLNAWNRQGYLLAHDPAIRAYLLGLFGIEESDDLVVGASS